MNTVFVNGFKDHAMNGRWLMEGWEYSDQIYKLTILRPNFPDTPRWVPIWIDAVSTKQAPIKRWSKATKENP